jgi:hypothetical protein
MLRISKRDHRCREHLTLLLLDSQRWYERIVERNLCDGTWMVHQVSAQRLGANPRCPQQLRRSKRIGGNDNYARSDCVRSMSCPVFENRASDAIAR